MTKLCIGLSGMVWGWAETFGWVWISFVLATAASNSRNSWLLNKLWEVISSSEKFYLDWPIRWEQMEFNLKTRLSLIRFCLCRFPFSLFVFWDFFVSFYFSENLIRSKTRTDLFKTFLTNRKPQVWTIHMIHKTGYIDVGEACWRPNVLMTSLA